MSCFNFGISLHFTFRSSSPVLRMPILWLWCVYCSPHSYASMHLVSVVFHLNFLWCSPFGLPWYTKLSQKAEMWSLQDLQSANGYNGIPICTPHWHLKFNTLNAPPRTFCKCFLVPYPWSRYSPRRRDRSLGGTLCPCFPCSLPLADIFIPFRVRPSLHSCHHLLSPHALPVSLQSLLGEALFPSSLHATLQPKGLL